MSDYIITPNGMIPVDDDVLMHWKYIKRVKKNGKWRYYYDEESLKRDIKDKLGYDERARFQKATTQYEKAAKNAKKADTKTSDAFNKLMTNPMPVKQRVPMTRAYDDAVTESNKASKKAEKAYEKVEKLKDEYSKTPIGKANEFVQKGENFFKTKVTHQIGDYTFSEYIGEAPPYAKKALKFVEDTLKKRDLLDKKVKAFDKTKHLTTKQAFQKAMDAENSKKPVKPSKLSDLYLKAWDGTPEEDNELINPNFSWYDYQYSHNCAYCAAAYDLRRRGYDVEATGKPENEKNTTYEISTWYNGGKVEQMDEILMRQGVSIDDALSVENEQMIRIIAEERKERDNAKNEEDVSLAEKIKQKLDKISEKQATKLAAEHEGLTVEEFIKKQAELEKKYGKQSERQECGYTIKDASAVGKALEKELLSHGENTRGILTTSWKTGSGHAVAYEVKNGKVRLMESQNGTIVSLEEYVELSSDIAYIRTDNLKPNKTILEGIKNRKVKK